MHPYVADLAAGDPVLAAELGLPADHSLLAGMEGLAEQAASQRTLLRVLEQRPSAVPGTTPWLEHELLLTDLRARLAEHDHQSPHQRAPYWYAERLGQAISALMRPDQDPRALGERVAEIPALLNLARRRLDPERVPTLWATMGAEAAAGLDLLLDRDLRRFLADQGGGASTAATLETARDAVRSYADHCRALVEVATGSWVAGQTYVETLLRDLHHLDLDADGLLALGEQLVAESEDALSQLGPQWGSRISRIKDHHPDGPDFLDAYARATQDSREWVTRSGLLDIPDGEHCEVGWVPEFLRASLPLGVMHVVPRYGSSLTSQFLITPLDDAATEEVRDQHRRDNNFAFIASIVGHETYPGHHLQGVWHKLGTPEDSVRRYFTTPLFVEGWGLYVEDLLAEQGAIGPDVLLLTRRNALWRALRIVVDVGLHTGRMTAEEATQLLVDRAGMGRHMAAGEVRRYTRHDNPTYTSSYSLGRLGLHRLRRRWEREAKGDLRSFHDAALGHGSPPLALLEPMIFEGEPA